VVTGPAGAADSAGFDSAVSAGFFSPPPHATRSRV